MKGTVEKSAIGIKHEFRVCGSKKNENTFKKRTINPSQEFKENWK